jgi:hypothetical protein
VAGAWACDSQSEVKNSGNKKAASLPGRLWCEGQLACQQHEIIMHDANDSFFVPEKAIALRSD